MTVNYVRSGTRKQSDVLDLAEPARFPPSDGRGVGQAWCGNGNTDASSHDCDYNVLDPISNVIAPFPNVLQKGSLNEQMFANMLCI